MKIEVYQAGDFITKIITKTQKKNQSNILDINVIITQVKSVRLSGRSSYILKNKRESSSGQKNFQDEVVVVLDTRTEKALAWLWVRLCPTEPLPLKQQGSLKMFAKVNSSTHS